MGMISEIENWPHAALQNRIKQNLRKMFQSYNALKSPQRSRLDQLIIRHRDYCLRESNDQYIREHNSFILHYVNGMSTKNTALSQVLSRRTVYKDIDAVLDRMLVYMLGFYGIRWDAKTKNK